MTKIWELFFLSPTQILNYPEARRLTFRSYLLVILSAASNGLFLLMLLDTLSYAITGSSAEFSGYAIFITCFIFSLYSTVASSIRSGILMMLYNASQRILPSNNINWISVYASSIVPLTFIVPISVLLTSLLSFIPPSAILVIMILLWIILNGLSVFRRRSMLHKLGVTKSGSWAMVVGARISETIAISIIAVTTVAIVGVLLSAGYLSKIF